LQIAYNPAQILYSSGMTLTASANRQKTGKALHTAILVRVACGIVERDGLAALTSRPLADAPGVSVTVLTHGYGSRDGVVAAVCATVREQDALLLDDWHVLLARVGTPGSRSSPGCA
jgi:DNA-binding transcriptional regulator YbjK